MKTHQLDAPRQGRMKWLLSLLALVVAIGVVWGSRVQRATLEWLVIRSEVPAESAFDELVQTDGDPLPFLERMWATGKIVHRQLVAQYLKAPAMGQTQSNPRADSILTAGATDVDASVRELSLGALAERRSPHLIPLAQEQLSDPDPLIRLSGLRYFSKANAQDALPLVIRLLDDPDPRVVTRADAALKAWTGEDFGVRGLQSVAVMNDEGRE